MSAEKPDETPLNDWILTQIKVAHGEATIYLKNGIKLTGKIMAFDKGSIQLTRSGDTLGVMVERDAVSSVQRFQNNESQYGGGANRKA